MKKALYILSAVILLIACRTEKPDKDIAHWKQEIMDTEKAFEESVHELGLEKGFLAFAADDAVLLRGDNIIVGKAALAESYANSHTDFSKVKLRWTPDFVDVATSGDLAYTYGKYKYTVIDSSGNEQSQEGYFHTVWKRQADGTWKFVWD